MRERKVSVKINDDVPDDLAVDHHKLAAGETLELLPRQADVVVNAGYATRVEAAPAAATTASATPAKKTTKR